MPCSVDDEICELQEGDDTILIHVVPTKPSRAPGKIKMNFEDMEKSREEELKKSSEEEKKRRYDENRRSFREAKRRSVVPEVGTQTQINIQALLVQQASNLPSHLFFF